MDIHRQVFMAGVHAACVARRVHESFTRLHEQDREFILRLCKEKRGIEYAAADLLDIERVFVPIDHALAQACAAWRTEAQENEVPLLSGGALPVGGQLLILEYLPIAPIDYGTSMFIDALSYCAQYYLSYAPAS